MNLIIKGKNLELTFDPSLANGRRSKAGRKWLGIWIQFRQVWKHLDFNFFGLEASSRTFRKRMNEALRAEKIRWLSGVLAAAAGQVFSRKIRAEKMLRFFQQLRNLLLLGLDRNSPFIFQKCQSGKPNTALLSDNEIYELSFLVDWKFKINK